MSSKKALKIAKWKTDKFQKMYDTHLEKLIEEFIIYVNENKYGEIDIKNKSISISYTDGTGDSENNDISDIINQISSLINQPGPRIRIIPNILFSNLIINDPTNIINSSFEEKNDIVKPMCKEFKEGLKKIK